MRAWWITGTVVTAFAWILFVVVQAVAGDPLPPDISVSQYGVGPHGWLFSIWMLTVAAGPCLLFRYRPTRQFGAGWWLLVGLLGSALMATVRTDPGGLQLSVNAKIHMAGSVLALVGLPLGIMFSLLAAARPWRRLSVALVAVSAVSLELLLFSAAGADTTGAGAATSWALWQSVALAVDLLLLVVQVFAVLTIPPLPGDPEPWWTLPGGAARIDGRRRHPPVPRVGSQQRAPSVG
jgi:hypothetical protein